MLEEQSSREAAPRIFIVKVDSLHLAVCLGGLKKTRQGLSGFEIQQRLSYEHQAQQDQHGSPSHDVIVPSNPPFPACLQSLPSEPPTFKCAILSHLPLKWGKKRPIE